MLFEVIAARDGTREKMLEGVTDKALGISIWEIIGSKQDTDLCRLGGLMSRTPTKFPKLPAFLSLLLPKPATSAPPFSYFFELFVKQPK